MFVSSRLLISNRQKSGQAPGQFLCQIQKSGRATRGTRFLSLHPLLYTAWVRGGRSYPRKHHVFCSMAGLLPPSLPRASCQSSPRTASRPGCFAARSSLFSRPWPLFKGALRPAARSPSVRVTGGRCSVCAAANRIGHTNFVGLNRMPPHLHTPHTTTALHQL